MYSYFNGIIKDINPKSLTIEVGGIGYLLNVANPYSFNLEEEKKIYVHQHVREDSITLFGFHSNVEKDLFLKLLSVTGIGPKSALSIIAYDANKTIEAIENGDSTFLKRFPGIGPKASQQIILDLKGKLANVEISSPKIIEVKDCLLSLGYKDKEIEKILDSLDQSKSIDVLIKDALSMFR